ncbi:YkuS family protein [Alkaliphilus serpentinus]|uniref:YkuS family protein n=1 Tax=Alkaliphilus serpentinus TaxID=1482731 RepID=A0A833MDK6_9FIRM|nr:YkuS family protein [Alkaliphilus serpentinus]
MGVEGSLTNVRDYLQQKGFKVEALGSNNNLNKYAAIVITGQDSNMMGIEDTYTKAPIIDARGQTAEAIHDEIRRRLS